MYNQLQSILADSHRIVSCYGNHSAKSEEVLKFSKKKTGRVHPDAPCKNPHTIAICTTGRSTSGTLCFSLLVA